MSLSVVLWGCGDLGSGVALRLFRIGCKVVIAELESPLVVRRSVSFAQAIYSGVMIVEDVTSKRVSSCQGITRAHADGCIPILIDPQLDCIAEIGPDVIIDARMLKTDVDRSIHKNPFWIGLGPGFRAPQNCHAVIETKRGPYLGRVIWDGSAEPDNGSPDAVGQHQNDRVLRAPVDGNFTAVREIGDVCDQGDVIGYVAGEPVVAPFRGLLRGLISSTPFVNKGLKIGDIDPRLDPQLIHVVSDKALAVGGGVIEAILTVREFRVKLGSTRT